MALMEASLDKGRTWQALPTPAPENYSPTYTHMEDSYVSANGYLVRDIIRRNRAKVTCGWKTLNASQMAFLQNLYDQYSFLLKFTDNYGNRVTKKVYGGPLDGKTKFYDKNSYQLTLRTDVQMNFIEF